MLTTLKKILADADKGGYDATAFWMRGGVADGLSKKDQDSPTMQRPAFGDSIGEVARLEAFHHHPSGLVTMRPGIPFQVNGVAVDLLSPESGEDFLEATLAAPPGTMMEAASLVYMKRKSPRRKDEVDVIELIKGGIDTRVCRAYLVAHAPAFVAAFDACVERAEAEQD